MLKIGHNLKYDWVMFAKAGITVAPYDDTLVMSFDLDAGALGPRHGRARQDAISTMSASPSSRSAASGKSQITFDKVPLDAPPNMPPRTPTSRCGCGSG